MSEDEPRVPEIDEFLELETSVRLDAERRDLELSDKLRNSELADRRQRRLLRALAFTLGALMIGGLAGLFVHVSHQLAGGILAGLDPSVQLALFVTPIVSATTITIFLLIGAFRGFRERDLERIPTTDMVKEVSRATSG